MSSYSPFIPRVIGTNLKNFFIGSARGRELRETRVLHQRARAAYDRYPLKDREEREKYVADIAFDICDASARFPPPRGLYLALCSLVESLLVLDSLAEFPDVASIETLSIEECVALRSQLWRLIRFTEDWDRLSDIWRNKIVALGRGIIGDLPSSVFDTAEVDDESEGALSLAIPLIDVCPAPATVVEKTIGTLYDDDVVGAHLYETVREQFELNLCAVSGIPFEQRGQTTRAVVLPTTYRAESNRELVSRYLQYTPFAEFLLTGLPFSVPEEVRYEHTHIIAGTGWGKSQTLQHLLLSDLQKPDPPALVVIDSQGEMLKKVAQLAIFDNEFKDKLIYIDPTDIEQPPALNMFDVTHLNQYSKTKREQFLNGLIELLEYVFAGLLKAELTQKQNVLFRYALRLMLHVPGATLNDLVKFLNDPTPYLQYTSELSEMAQEFFRTEFADKSFLQTRQQIRRRLFGVLENDAFRRMFTAPKNNLNMLASLNSGSIILVDTAKSHLKEDASSLLGRYFIALTLQAAIERSDTPAQERKGAFLYIDEAGEYFDDNIDTFLNEARKRRVGCVMAHQYLDQLTPQLRSSIATNTSIKLAGGISDRDAKFLAPEMRTTSEFIAAQKKDNSQTSFACYVRNFVPKALSVTVPFGTLEQEPQMSVSAFKSFYQRNRDRVGMAKNLITVQPALDALSELARQHKAGSPPATDRPKSSSQPREDLGTQNSDDWSG